MFFWLHPFLVVAGHHDGGEDICIFFAEERFFFSLLV